MASSEPMDIEPEIDDSLYSRQRYVLGDTAMKRMAKSDILLIGLGGLGVEIAKNITLAGVKSLTLQDNEVCSVQDLGTQFFIKETDVVNELNRASACANLIAELNPYCKIQTIEKDVDTSNLSYLDSFNCVILTECPLNVQMTVNEYCRSKSPQIKFISSDVFGIFSSTFCDFGDSFEIFDADGEDVRETFIDSVNQSKNGVVQCIEHARHGLETGDYVTFREVKGMTELNNKIFQVKTIESDPSSLCIGDTSSFSKYEGGGIMKTVKVPKTIQFESLSTQIQKPSIVYADLSKFDMPSTLHLAFITLHKYIEEKHKLPRTWNDEDAEEFLQIASSLNGSVCDKIEINEEILLKISMTAGGCLAPMCAVIGGVVAQEALKAVSGKFAPLKQWLHLDAIEVVDEGDCKIFEQKNDRYDLLRTCIGNKILDKLQQLRLFMVGCGAIGCEMLKNYALLGVATTSGCVTITDNDLIEKSNLNRQFLFRPKHIRKPKSVIAAQSTRDINPEMNIEAHQHKVCPETENSVYTDGFFTSQNVCVNALDNLTARRYMDSRCVANQRPLLESGTMGPKGHVQVIYPFLTESYTSQRDPADNDVPYCTLKSFPQNMNHCIQWAREKFQSSFSSKPATLNKFFQENPDTSVVTSRLTSGSVVDGAVTVAKILSNQPANWGDCVKFARWKFEKYFNHRAKQLLHIFPEDTKLKDGSAFWQSPKRPPKPVIFNLDDPIHFEFIKAGAKLYADIYRVNYSSKEMEREHVANILKDQNIPEFRPVKKEIETSEAAKKPSSAESFDADSLSQTADLIREKTEGITRPCLNVLEFEKDDDTNGHIDFISAAANLRGAMYSIEKEDRLKIKRIAGRIVPAIATTTAAVAGLVAIELIKVVKKSPLEHFKNAFMNLALPQFVLCEPGAAPKRKLNSGLEFTLWDRLEVNGCQSTTLQQFIDMFKAQHKLEINMVVQGAKMIYMPYMPTHKKRLQEPLVKYANVTPDKNYVDLLVSFEGAEEDEEAPPLRFYYR